MHEFHYLYVIAAGPDGPCKLGRSAEPVRRLKQFQTAQPQKLQLYYQHPVPAHQIKAYEGLLHLLVIDCRTLGEWYDISVANAIKEVVHVEIRFAQDMEDGRDPRKPRTP